MDPIHNQNTDLFVINRLNHFYDPRIRDRRKIMKFTLAEIAQIVIETVEETEQDLEKLGDLLNRIAQASLIVAKTLHDHGHQLDTTLSTRDLHTLAHSSRAITRLKNQKSNGTSITP
jgi:hypothetical protein